MAKAVKTKSATKTTTTKKKKQPKSTKERIRIEKQEKKENRELTNEMHNTLTQIKEIELPEDYYPYCSFNESNKTIVIDLEKLFDRDDISYANAFSLTRRNYYSIAPQIVNDYNLILNAPECEDFIFWVLEVKSHIVDIKDQYLKEEKGYILKNKKMTDFEKKSKMILEPEDKQFLLKKVNKIMELDYLFDFVANFVDEHYALNLNTHISVNDKNLEYVITDDINKVVLKTSIVSRLLIPIINEIGINDNELYRLLTRVMNRFDGNTTKAKNKLYKFIELRINRTRYSDSTIWEFLSNRSVDSTLFIAELNRKILNEIVCKLEYNKSIVSYFDVIIRYKTKFLFTYNYTVNYKTIKTNDKELDEKEKLEIHLNKHDSFDLRMNNLSIKQLTDTFEVDEDEYNLEIIEDLENPFTTKLLEIFYYKYGFLVNLATKEQRAKLIIHMRDVLSSNGFSIIPELLISEINVNERRSTVRKKIDPDIVMSPKYKKFEKTYKNVISLFIANNNPLMQLASIKSYSAYVVDKDNNASELEYDYKTLVQEILDLWYYYI